MFGKLSRKSVLIGIVSIVILTLLAFSVVPVMAADSSTTTPTPGGFYSARYWINASLK